MTICFLNRPGATIQLNALKALCIGAALFMQANVALADWQYKQDTDPMTDGVHRIASIGSATSLNLNPPYSGQNNALLVVRNHPRQGLGVLLTIDKGQFICDSSLGCDLLARFDNGKPVQLRGARSTGLDRNLIFIKNPQRFVLEASKARRILLQPNIFNNGAPVIEFTTSAPLSWQLPPASKPPQAKQEPSKIASEEKDALCGPHTNLGSTGECGRLYAECFSKSRVYTRPAADRYLTTCRRKGVDAADREAEHVAATTGTQWPAPPPHVSGN